MGTHTWTGCCWWCYHCRTLPAPRGEMCQEICCNNPAPGSGLISSHTALSNEAKHCQLFKTFLPFWVQGKQSRTGAGSCSSSGTALSVHPALSCVGQDKEKLQQSKISCLVSAWGHCCCKLFTQGWSATMGTSGGVGATTGTAFCWWNPGLQGNIYRCLPRAEGLEGWNCLIF